MAASVEIQILDALGGKLLGISGIGTRVYDYYRAESAVEGKPAICFYAIQSSVVGDPIASTRRKLWDLDVEIIGYVGGGDVRAKAYDLAKLIETALETDTTLGVDNVEQCRVMEKLTANMGDGDTQHGNKGVVQLAATVRFRTTIGSP